MVQKGEIERISQGIYLATNKIEGMYSARVFNGNYQVLQLVDEALAKKK